MIIEEKRNGSVAIIDLKGKMAGACDAEELHDEVKALLESNTNHIVLNMQHVHWIGSLCIGALMREIISARQKEGLSGGSFRKSRTTVPDNKTGRRGKYLSHR
jgi:anti-anti-sigma factor